MQRRLEPKWEKWAGWVLGLGAIAWAVYHASYHVHTMGEAFKTGYIRLGPMQVFMVGLMIWLHGRFRASMSADHA
ncbi:MAG TPA: hypothetical protein VKZ53_00040 [Candidatus Angelobacter sp.]|nr:hypothetical protein [Candidatus Angelobacter sp.]